MNIFVAYPATLAAKRERLIIFRCVVGKKRVAKKNIIATDGVNRIPTAQTINLVSVNQIQLRGFRTRALGTLLHKMNNDLMTI